LHLLPFSLLLFSRDLSFHVVELDRIDEVALAESFTTTSRDVRMDVKVEGHLVRLNASDPAVGIILLDKYRDKSSFFLARNLEDSFFKRCSASVMHRLVDELVLLIVQR